MPEEVRSLYRRWRSRTFGELIGQEHVSRTLLSALRQGRVAHAYLFTGPRGSGKTSTARILAKAVNCLNNNAAGEPCNECEMCVAINQGRALDLFEIDAASNRGIDEIRELRDKVNFSPTQARYKVYILDEVHMLTNEAFNALLKTLEEPPPHVIFALVTTEAHKIPATILSRCQRFDFHRASVKDILSKLNHICREEKINIEPAALELIARAATGSYRDAESLLDQIAGYSGEETISRADVEQILGMPPAQAAGALIGRVAERDTAGGLKLLNEIAEGGGDLRQFNRELIDYLRGLLLIKTNNAALLNTTADAAAEMTGLAARFGVADLVRLIKTFGAPDVTSGLRFSTQPQLPLELAFLEACRETAHPTAGGDTAAGASVTPAAPPPPARSTPADTPPAPAALRSAPAAVQAPYQNPAAARPAPQAATQPAAARPAAPAHPPFGAQISVTAPPGTPLADVQSHWAAVLESVKASSRSVEAFLKECRPVAAEADIVTLGFFYPFHKESVENPKNRPLVEDALGKVLGHAIRLRCTLAPKDAKQAPGATRDKMSAAMGDPVVRAAVEKFDAKILDVEGMDERDA